jgi:hypothetical protein
MKIKDIDLDAHLKYCSNNKALGPEYIAQNGHQQWLLDEGYINWMLVYETKWMEEAGYIDQIIAVGNKRFLAENDYVDVLIEQGEMHWLAINYPSAFIDNGGKTWMSHNGYVYLLRQLGHESWLISNGFLPR